MRLPHWWRRLATLAALCVCMLVPALAHAMPAGEKGIGLPRDVSVDGYRIDWLIKVTMIFVTILFVIMCVWMVYAALRHDEKHEAEYDHGNSKHAVVVAMTLSAIIFFVVDGNLWVNATLDLSRAFWNFSKAESHPEAVRIEVNAHQWAWDARYPGPDGKFNTADDIVLLNDIRVPYDRPVIIQLASTDVIHSFYLPNFRIKQDAMPGMINRFWFEADSKKVRSGEQFDIGCAQHCGTHHYKMKGLLTVLSPEDWKQWANEASHTSSLTFDDKDQDAHWGWEWKEKL